MRRALTLMLVAATLSACSTYEPEPVSPYQWQQRQEAERLRRCETMDKQSERYTRECARAGASQ